jgi:type I restriction enzyme S subunit
MSSEETNIGDRDQPPTLALTPTHRHELEAILRAAGVDFARHRPVVFGSRADGTSRRYSDIDVGLAGEPLAFDQLARLTEALEDSDLPYRVDVVNLAQASDEFREVAVKAAIPLGHSTGGDDPGL